MLDDYLIRKDSLENVLDGDEIIGFKFAIRIADYRGCFLSLVNGYFVKCDNVEYSKEVQKLEINGKVPRTFEEISHCIWEHWDYDDEAFLHISKDGGLGVGSHEIAFQQSILAQYGYMPWDEEWVMNPPQPGKGGSGKTDTVSTFKLELLTSEVNVG